jgi:hypothetical protein
MAMFAVDAEKLREKVWLNGLVVLVRAALENNIFKKKGGGLRGIVSRDLGPLFPSSL